MAYLEKNYATERDQYGMLVITVSGRCTESERTTVEGSVTSRFELLQFPNSRGVVLKPLDGTRPRIVEIQPPTFGGVRYRCVKIDGYCNPHATLQTEGTYAGKYILRFVMRYQQVGSVA